MSAYIIGGLVGFAVGAAVQRIVIYFAVNTVFPTICDYCHWKKENQWRWEKKKNRHTR